MEENNINSVKEVKEDIEEGQKTFTQEEVDKIVEKRLSRQKNKYENIMKGLNPELDSIEEREQGLKRREMEFKAKQMLIDENIPVEAVAFLNIENDEALTNSIETFKSVLNKIINPMIEYRLRGGRPLKEVPVADKDSDLMRSAFGLK